MNFKPMFDRVVVQENPTETRTSSGLYIPDSSVEQVNTGTVLAVGPGRTNEKGVLIPMTVLTQDRVMFAPGAGIRVRVEGLDLLLLTEDDIIAVVD